MQMPDSSSSDEELPELPQRQQALSEAQVQPEQELHPKSSFVVATYEEQWFLAELVKNQSDVATGFNRLNYTFIKEFISFGWGDKEDIHITLNEDILMSVVPQPVNHLGLNN
jgi:hypothetical protein